jgi:hypothetical protein
VIAQARELRCVGHQQRRFRRGGHP